MLDPKAFVEDRLYTESVLGYHWEKNSLWCIYLYICQSNLKSSASLQFDQSGHPLQNYCLHWLPLEKKIIKCTYHAFLIMPYEKQEEQNTVIYNTLADIVLQNTTSYMARSSVC